MSDRTSTPIDMLTVPNKTHIRNAYAAIIILLLTGIPRIAVFGGAGIRNNLTPLLIVAGIMLVTSLIDLSMLFVVRKGRSNLAMMIVITDFILVTFSAVVTVQGLGLIIAVITLMVIVAISNLAMPRRFAVPGAVVGSVFSVSFYLLDIYFTGNRLIVEQIQAVAPYVATVVALGFSAIGIREFNRFSLRVKIALGTLVTGAVTVGVLVFFGLGRSNEITQYLLQQFEQTNSENVKQQIVSGAENNANQMNELFTVLVGDINIITSYRANIEEHKDVLSQGSFWDANTRLVQLASGQYGNPGIDPAAIFIPSTIPLTDSIITDLNTTAYLDFYALNFLKGHPEVVALYYIGKSGTTTYYPNIDLAHNLPSDFDPRTQPFYTISAPSAGPDRSPKWIEPYQDPAGQGLIVTLSAPVYLEDRFLGVIGIDIQLKQFIDRVNSIKFGETGYAFLIDNAGHILAMPPEGYELFGITPEVLPDNGSPEQSLIGKGSGGLQNAVNRMIKDQVGIEVISANGENLYVAFAPLNTPNYHLGIVAPEDEFTAKLVSSKNEAEQRVQETLRGISLILVLLFIGAAVFSLLVGQIITSPLLRLTQAAESIARGDLNARAQITSEDETGILARAFNSMTERLSENLSTLEERVSARTLELETANERNTRRANQFEAIARVASTIRSTQDLSKLLPLITVTISEQFDFYHVGIFLVDSQREYAVLVAANSEGGKRMLDRNHRLRVGGTGIVGYVTQSGQARISLDVGQDAVYFNNPDLPDTRSEISLPLRIGADTFGALDVQSKQINAFNQDDINILSTLADQVSVAIQNARSYQQTREALAQAEAASAQLSNQQWKQFLNRQEVHGFSYDGVETTQISQSEKVAHTLAIPILLRGTKIGTIKLSAANPERMWTDGEIGMVQAVADRASLALESARLLQEAQKRATKERVIGEISAKIGSSSNLESILQTAIQELGSTLPGTDIAIQFKNEDTE